MSKPDSQTLDAAESASPEKRAAGASDGKTGDARPQRARKPKPGRKDSGPAVNFIRPVSERDRESERRPFGKANSAQADSRSVDNESNAVGPPRDNQAMPAELVGRYIQDGKHWYLPNGDKGFTDHGNRLTTRSENARIIQDFIAIARERGWDRIVVGGSKEFRRQAWREAKLEGLEVAGYKPTRVEQALLIRSLASAGARGDARTESLHEPLRPGRAETLDQGREPERAAPPATGRPTPHSEPLITGRLLDHGRAPYPQDQDGAQSYFVTIKRDKSENLTVWGVDLERAIRQSLTSVEIGDQIGLRSVSRSDFRLKTQRPGEDGRPVEQEVDAHRNGWIVEQKRFFVDRAALAKAFRDETEKPSDVVRRHPELGGTYLEFQASKLHIEKTVAHPEDRAAFLRALRERIAAAIERGEPLKPVHMKQHAPHREPGTPGANGANGHAMPDPQVLVR